MKVVRKVVICSCLRVLLWIQMLVDYMNVLLRGIIAELLEIHHLGLIPWSTSHYCDLGHLSLPFLYLGFLLNRGNSNTFTRLLWRFNELIHLKHLKLKQYLVNGKHSIYVRIDHYNVYCCCLNFQLNYFIVLQHLENWYFHSAV